MAGLSNDKHLSNLYRMEHDAVQLLRDAEAEGDKRQTKDCSKLLASIRQSIRACGGKPDA